MLHGLRCCGVSINKSKSSCRTCGNQLHILSLSKPLWMLRAQRLLATRPKQRSDGLLHHPECYAFVISVRGVSRASSSSLQQIAQVQWLKPNSILGYGRNILYTGRYESVRTRGIRFPFLLSTFRKALNVCAHDSVFANLIQNCERSVSSWHHKILSQPWQMVLSFWSQGVSDMGFCW